MHGRDDGSRAARWLTGCLLLASLVLIAPGRSAVPCLRSSEGGQEAVRQSWDALRAAHRDGLPGPAGARQRARVLQRLVDQRLDLTAFTAYVLQGVWEGATADPRARWTAILRRVLEARHLQRLRDPSPVTLTLTGVSMTCEDVVVTGTIATRRGAVKSDVTFYLRSTPGGFRAWNVHVDGVSLAGTWRTRFDRILSRDGPAGVMAELALLGDRYPEFKRP